MERLSIELRNAQGGCLPSNPAGRAAGPREQGGAEPAAAKAGKAGAPQTCPEPVIQLCETARACGFGQGRSVRDLTILHRETSQGWLPCGSTAGEALVRSRPWLRRDGGSAAIRRMRLNGAYSRDGAQRSEVAAGPTPRPTGLASAAVLPATRRWTGNSDKEDMKPLPAPCHTLRKPRRKHHERLLLRT